ncbi:MAG TPA: protein kinase, partial [Stenomitos sp.]
GSPAYMAPERFYGHFSVESDIYAIGVMLFELIVGWRPFSGMPIDVMKAHLNQPLRVPKSVPARLKDVLQKALQKLPQHRYSSAEQMRLALEPIIAACSPYQQVQPTRSHKLETASLSPAHGNASAVAPSAAVNDNLSQPDPDVRQIVLAPEQLQHQAQLATPVHRLWMTPKGCVGLASTEDGLGLWLWADQGLQQVGQLPIPTASLQDAALFASRAVDLSADGMRLAVLQPSNPISNSDALPHFLEGEAEFVANQLSVYSVPNLRPIHQSSLSVDLTRLRWIGSRHLIGTGATLKDLSQPDASEPSLYLLNRRGHSYWACPVRAEIQHVVVSSTHPDRVFAIAQGPQPAAFFLSLRPFRAQRIALAMQPHWVSATQWGYILVDLEGRIHCINRRGRLLAQAQFPLEPGATLQAIAATPSATLWIAMRCVEQTHLVTLDLSPHLPQSLRRL